MNDATRPSERAVAGADRDQLEDILASAREDGGTCLLPYMTAGLPDVGSSLSMFETMADAGADGFEVGIPYSDPLMDGPTIHEAGLRAIDGGMSIGLALDLVAGIRQRTGKPVIVMSYVNPVLRMGLETFGRVAAEAGAAAVILADLPVDEAGPFREAFAAHGVGMVLFLAPTSGVERLEAVVAAAPTFIYGVAEVGVTGERSAASSHAVSLAARIRERTEIPLVLGVGISTPAHATFAAGVADGIIVGSALVRRVLDASGPDTAARSLHKAVSELARAIDDRTG
jgi:tryptophan synthase alpha chain